MKKITFSFCFAIFIAILGYAQPKPSDMGVKSYSIKPTSDVVSTTYLQGFVKVGLQNSKEPITLIFASKSETRRVETDIEGHFSLELPEQPPFTLMVKVLDEDKYDIITDMLSIENDNVEDIEIRLSAKELISKELLDSLVQTICHQQVKLGILMAKAQNDSIQMISELISWKKKMRQDSAMLNVQIQDLQASLHQVNLSMKKKEGIIAGLMEEVKQKNADVLRTALKLNDAMEEIEMLKLERDVWKEKYEKANGDAKKLYEDYVNAHIKVIDCRCSNFNNVDNSFNLSFNVLSHKDEPLKDGKTRTFMFKIKRTDNKEYVEILGDNNSSKLGFTQSYGFSDNTIAARIRLGKGFRANKDYIIEIYNLNYNDRIPVAYLLLDLGADCKTNTKMDNKISKEITVSSFDLSFRVIDMGLRDNDRVNMTINGITLFKDKAAGSTNVETWEKFLINESNNVLEIQSVSAGKDGNNTAVLEIRDEKTGEIKRLALNGKQKAEKAILIVKIN